MGDSQVPAWAGPQGLQAVQGPWQAAAPIAASHQQSQRLQQPAVPWVPLGGSGAPAAGATAASAGAALQPVPAQQHNVWDTGRECSQWGSGRLDAETMAAKLAAAREKNRLAQQRFRERQRAKQRETDEQADALHREMEELRLENEALVVQNRIYEKVLAVRDALVHTLSTLHHVQHGNDPRQRNSQLQQEQREQQAAALELTDALDHMPSAQEIDDAARAAEEGAKGSDQPTARGGAAAAAAASDDAESAPGQAGPAALRPKEKTAGSAGEGSHQQGSSNSCPSGDSVQQGAPEWPLAGRHHHKVGAAAELDGSMLQSVPSIPPATDALVRRMVMDMAEPEQLLDYWRQWQAELGAMYAAAEAVAFDEESAAELEALHTRMASVFWHVGHLKPAYLCYLVNAALPEDSARFPLWRDIAERILPQLDANSRAILRRAWHRYSKEMAKIGVRVSRWAQKLREFTVRPVQAMSTNAAQSMEVAEIMKQLAAAVQDEYVASMEFIAEQAPGTSSLQKSMMNAEAAPFMPDVVCINYHILALDAQERRARGQGTVTPAPPCGLSAPAVPAPAAPAADA